MSESENKAPEPDSIPEPGEAAPEEAEVVAHDDEELEACCVLNNPS